MTRASSRRKQLTRLASRRAPRDLALVSGEQVISMKRRAKPHSMGPQALCITIDQRVAMNHVANTSWVEQPLQAQCDDV